MKRNILFALVATITVFVVPQISFAEGSFAGNEAGVMNKQYMDQLKDEAIEYY